MDLSRPAHLVAPDLIGARIRSTLGPPVCVLITEVEAYGGEGEDEASHAHRGRTARNATMFGRPGLLYVYLSHGLHWCVNVTTGDEGTASAVLLRAGEVIEGVETAQGRRRAARTTRDLARGPGRLGAALGVTGAQDGTDLLDKSAPVRLLPRLAEPAGIVTSTRVGITRDAHRPWRWHWEGHRSVSAARSLRP
jgi:DNA-3-methyladenine glycosylase